MRPESARLRPGARHAGGMTTPSLIDWVARHEGVVHRDELMRAGFRVESMRALVRSGAAEMIRRAWVALPDAAPDLVRAARAGGRVSCVSLARRRGWWMPEGIDDGLHLHLHPGASSARLDPTWRGVLHWTKPIAPGPRTALAGAIEDALDHIARCVPHDGALALWESAAKNEQLSPEALRRVRWLSRAASDLAREVTGLDDSGLETIVVRPLLRWGLPVRQQVMIAGHRVDVLIGERLVLQIDGYQFHSDAAQRAADIAHDAELRLRGYTVIRVSYSQVVRDWSAVERIVRRAVAAGLHLAA